MPLTTALAMMLPLVYNLLTLKFMPTNVHVMTSNSLKETTLNVSAVYPKQLWKHKSATKLSLLNTSNQLSVITLTLEVESILPIASAKISLSTNLSVIVQIITTKSLMNYVQHSLDLRFFTEALINMLRFSSTTKVMNSLYSLE